VVLTLDEGWHVNAHEAGEGQRPTVLSLAEDGQVSLEEVVYPEGASLEAAFADTPLLVYGKEVTLEAALSVTGMPGEEDFLQLELTFQACDDSRCLAPDTIGLAVRALDLSGG